jgi:hypothetical protein
MAEIDYNQILIQRTVNAILNNQGRLKYTDIHEAMQGTTSWKEGDLVIFYLEMSVISHNIPIWENSGATQVPLSHCFRRAITFYNSYKDETEIVNRSQSGFGQNLLYNGFYLPKLTFVEPKSHAVFTHGSGKPLPDLKDEDGLTYEVKYGYFRPREDGKKTSPSSLHTANYLIDCTNPGIAVYSVVNNKADSNALARYSGILSNRVREPLASVSKFTMDLIYSGELIPEIEKRLHEAGFVWNP